MAGLQDGNVNESPAPSRSGFRLPIASVISLPDGSVRYGGRVAAGSVRAGDAMRLLPSGVQTRVATVLLEGNPVEEAWAGTGIELVLADVVAAQRGDVLATADAPPEVADQFEVSLLWLGANPMTPGRQYLMKLACHEVTATITAIKHREDPATGAPLAARTLKSGDTATVKLATNIPMVFEPASVSRILGEFTLADRVTGDTVGTGSIDFALRRASNIHWQALELDKARRAQLKGQRPRCIWFTGLSGSGKSTIANLLEKRLYAEGKHTYLLDGDNVRHGLNRDLGFTEADRVENIRRVGEVARLMVDAGLIVLVSFISPFRSERRMARDLFAEGEFVEVYVDTPIEECERRDVKGLYAKARKGELKNFTGIDSPYEAPESPQVHIRAAIDAPDLCVENILRALDQP